MLRTVRPSLLTLSTAFLLLGVGPAVTAPARAASSATVVTVTADDTGAPIANACVSAWTLPSQLDYHFVERACTDAKGLATLSTLTTGTGYTLEVGAAGYAAEWAQDGYGDLGSGQQFVAPITTAVGLARPATLHGTLSLADGTPAGNAAVSISPSQGHGGFAYTHTDPLNGTWSANVAPGDYRISFDRSRVTSWAHGRRTYDTADVIHVPGGGSVTVDDSLPPIPAPNSISGRVTRAGSGAALSGICLTAWSPDFVTSGPQACTGPDGSYRLDDVAPGTWVVNSTDPQGRWGSITSPPVTLATGQDVRGVDLRVAPAATLTGTVVDATTGRPVPGTCGLVWLGHRGRYAPSQRPTCSGPDGVWSVTGLAPGRYTVQLTPNDGAHQTKWARDAETQAGATVYPAPAGRTVRIGTTRVELGGSITGRVTDTAGHPIAGATVNYGSYSNLLADGGRSAQTDADGRYAITNVDAGRDVVVTSAYRQPYAWTFSGGVGDPAKAKKITVRYGRSTRYDAVLGPEAPLTVVIAGGSPDVGYLIDTYTPGGSAVGFHSSSTGNGSAAIHGLPAGPVKIEVTLPDNRTAWYDGASSLAGATAVTTTVGSRTTVTVRLPT